MDFPRIPYPDDAVKSWNLAELDKQLRQVHLLESGKLETLEVNYSVKGGNSIKKVLFVDEKIYINVPQIAWNFCIGNYPPAQQWLKDRKNLYLSFDDINSSKNYKCVIFNGKIDEGN
jgi:hypothetical protein